MAHLILKTWIHKKDDLAEFALQGFQKEFDHGNYPRLFMGVDPFGFMRIHNIDAQWSPNAVFHTDGPLEFFKEEVLRCMYHTSVLGFPSKTSLAMYVQDMAGLDIYFSAIGEDGKIAGTSRKRDVHISGHEHIGSYDLYNRHPRFNRPFRDFTADAEL